MQTFKFFLINILSFISVFATAQSKTESVKVYGSCGMCQPRIEKAAKAAGASSAKWDARANILTVSYSIANTSLSKIETKVASVGHDTKNQTASDQSYNKLHGCCQYERKASTTTSSCCNTGASCCTKNQTCCSTQKSTSSTSVNSCCGEGSSCCGSGQNCCSKATTASTSAVTNCCSTGATCCKTGAVCCNTSDVGGRDSKKGCCADGAVFCAGGAACCVKQTV
jgi:periplasmic mercuric ion binding protein